MRYVELNKILVRVFSKKIYSKSFIQEIKAATKTKSCRGYNSKRDKWCLSLRPLYLSNQLHLIWNQYIIFVLLILLALLK